MALVSIADIVEARLGSHEKYHPAAETESASNGRLIVIMADSADSLSESAPSFAESKYMVSKLNYVLNGYIVENVPDTVLKEILNSDQVKAVYEVRTVSFVYTGKIHFSEC